MDQSERIQAALGSATDFRSFAADLLGDCLRWPLGDKPIKPQDVGYEWSANELGMPETGHKAKAYEILLRPRADQPWGIFLLEFDEPKVFETRGFGTPLRAVLRRLVAGKRKEANLPSWNLGNILFICTHNYKQYVFGMFRDTFGTGKVADAKLATFGWVPGQPSRTAVTENLPSLAWPEDEADKAAWVQAWSAAFDKEPLTRKFFKQFDAALELIKSDLEKLGKLDSPEAYSKAQLLLERLIFLYFVQNRGWLDQRRGFLLEGFESHRNRPKECSYYADFLDMLFWSLSSAASSTFERWDNVPFLNGGLFNDDEFEPSPRRKKDNPPLPVRNVTFEKVFDDLLEAFNFTVREDTPLNQEVAVDPEMLGKVFESIVLHAEAADETATAPDKRKETGSFYTPRIVVHFICREVLYQWLLPRLTGDDWPGRLRQLLELDASDGLDKAGMTTLKSCLSSEEGTLLLELVKALRCCDPAVGSGAFMVGLLHELTNLRRLAQTAANGYVDPLRQQGSRWLHDTKADIIENCLFGVDIQQQAIEICMLRLWLSLVVDYDLGVDPISASPTQFRAALKDISQLPNLEMNFKRGDSLHDHICGVPVVILPGKEHRYQKLFDAIHRLGERLHKAKSWNAKRNLRLDILKKRLEVSESVISDELQLLRRKDSIAAGLFGEGKSDADRRQRIAHETQQLEDALKGVKAAQKERDRLEEKPLGHTFVQQLRKLEGASFDAPFNFAWRIDFPQVFYPEGPKTTMNGRLALGNELRGQMDLAVPTPSVGGFDIFVGNPPFVTARNPEKRELYRERWQPFCLGKYNLLVPFFPLSFRLLRHGGQLGFIVSNAFAKREFGRPLVEQFFPTVNLQKVVDCSGLMFPGHGTPTCLVFGASQKPDAKTPVRVAAILPGGGDLRTPPEDSPLWHTLEHAHDLPGFVSPLVSVGDRPRNKMGQFPWLLDASAQATSALMQSAAGPVLADVLNGNIGYGCVTRADDIYYVPWHLVRRAHILPKFVLPEIVGDRIRNWSFTAEQGAVFPYEGDNMQPAKLTSQPDLRRYLEKFRDHLAGRTAYGKTQLERGLGWFEYSMLFKTRMQAVPLVCFADIATHNHYTVFNSPMAYKDTAPIFSVLSRQSTHLASGLLNASAALLWLKQTCFNKGAGEDEERDRYEFLTGKVEQLPVPDKVAQALKCEWNPLAKRLAEMAEECWKRGQKLPSLAMKKLFEKPGEAYHEWNSSLPGYEKPHTVVGMPFGSAEELKQAYDRVVSERERLRAEMIALQEEMDWLVYAAYSLLPEENPAVKVPATLEPLAKDDRPYRLWQRANGDFASAINLIPGSLSDSRKRLWRERLAAIRDNEHIRRIEQPVYKRRWDEQWKVKNRWECGPVAYEQELADAFDWWLLEKAEWYLEHKKDGGPAELSAWALGLWRDARVQAAVEVIYPALAGPEGFMRLLKEKVDEEALPDGIPFAKPWEDLEKKHVKSELNKARKIRGKLNVPRERFHLVSKGVYKWAGLLFR
jgi:hypothetical protein